MFRTPGVAVLAALLFAICATPVAFAAPGLVAVYLVPLAFVVWVVRVRTTADADGLVVRQPFTSRRLGWDSLKGLRLTKRAGVRAVLGDDSEVALPSVRVRHLPALALVSGGRLDDPTERAGHGADEADPIDAADSTNGTTSTDAADPDVDGATEVTEVTAADAANDETGAAPDAEDATGGSGATPAAPARAKPTTSAE